MVVGMLDSMRYCKVLVVMVWVCGVHGDSEEGVEGLEEGFMFDDISNDTALDYNEGSGEVDREPFRDILDFPVCVTDEDCEEISMDSGSDYRCFQYMCYPWGRGEEGVHSGAARGGQTVMDWWKKKEEMAWMETATGIMIGGMSLLESASIPVRYSPALSTRTAHNNNNNN